MAAPIAVRCPSRFLRRLVSFHPRSTWMSSKSSPDEYATKQDPFQLYAKDEVQTLLRKMTGFNLMKIAGPKKTPLERPSYKLLTDIQLSQEQESAETRLAKYLDNPPPYMNPRRRVREPLAVDPDLAHFDTSSYVFSDISFGVKDRERSVVVREVDGSLQVAPWDLKERMNQLYNPRAGRSMIKPQMFEEEHMERLISQKKYVYILERACAQFEPDDPDFLRTCHRVYSAVNASGDFDLLRSTQFFAPMTFHYIWTKMVDSLLIDMLNRDLESDVIDLFNLYCLVHQNDKCAEAVKNIQEKNAESVVKVFLETETQTPNEVELALQAMLDRKRQKTKNSISQSN